MKRLHVHVAVDDLSEAVGFYSGLFAARPCCGGRAFAQWRIDEPPVNFATSVVGSRHGFLHFGLEVDSAEQLHAADRALHGGFRPSSAVPWEISVRKEERKP